MDTRTPVTTVPSRLSRVRTTGTDGLGPRTLRRPSTTTSSTTSTGPTGLPTLLRETFRPDRKGGGGGTTRPLEPGFRDRVEVPKHVPDRATPSNCLLSLTVIGRLVTHSYMASGRWGKCRSSPESDYDGRPVTPVVDLYDDVPPEDEILPDVLPGPVVLTDDEHREVREVVRVVHLECEKLSLCPYVTIGRVGGDVLCTRGELVEDVTSSGTTRPSTDPSSRTVLAS